MAWVVATVWGEWRLIPCLLYTFIPTETRLKVFIYRHRCVHCCQYSTGNQILSHRDHFLALFLCPISSNDSILDDSNSKEKHVLCIWLYHPNRHLFDCERFSNRKKNIICRISTIKINFKTILKNISVDFSLSIIGWAGRRRVQLVTFTCSSLHKIDCWLAIPINK